MLVLWCFTLLAVAMASPAACPSTCNNITIEFPFGLSENCSMSNEFSLTCSRLNGTESLLYTNYYQNRITNISRTQVTIQAKLMDSFCRRDNNTSWFSFHGMPSSLVLSSDNTYMIVGCNSYGMIIANTSEGKKLVSCTTFCAEKKDTMNDNCSGVGCCQVPIPKGIQFKYIASLDKIHDVSVIRIALGKSIALNKKCSYSFVASKESTKGFRRAVEADAPDFEDKLSKLPVVFDWFIPNNTCREYNRNKTAYVCKQNSFCVDIEQELGVYGYRCECISGFDGNPYVDGGCKDIDECKGLSTPCSHTCTNTQGSFSCSCPRGYHIVEGGTFQCFPNKMSIVLPIGLGVAFGTLLFLVAGYWIFIFAKKRRQAMEKARNFKRNGGLLLNQQLSSSEGMIERTRVFTQTELNKATEEFSESRVLGQGGQGAVYKGMLGDGNIVAIKKSKTVGLNHVGVFINELVLLSQVNHRSIVKLLGCCLETETPMLVYEFVPNGTLSRLLREPDVLELTWRMRLQIAIDLADALSYLHTSSSTPILHRDVKSDNILLDASYRAKLSDFGISRTIGIDESHISTGVQGTFGYMDPEYQGTNRYTDKSDVYAFGVVLTELLTGQKALMPPEIYEERSLVWWFREKMKKKKLFDVVDIQVARHGRNEDIVKVANLAISCMKKSGQRRPSMKDVLTELERIKSLQASTSTS